MRSVKLGDIARWGSGGTPKRSTPEFFGNGVPWLSIADLNDGLVTDAKESLSPSGIANSSAKVVPEGTILIAMYGSIGKLGIAGQRLCTSQAIAFAQPDESQVDPRYLFHFLLSERPRFQNRGRGGTQQNIGQGDLKEWPIPLPTIAEQRRIGEILDQADAIRAKRRRVLGHLDDLTQSIFHDMFGESSSAPVTLKTVATVKGGKRLPKGEKYAEEPTAHPYIRVTDLENGQIDPAHVQFISPAVHSAIAPYTVNEGDVIITIAGSIGRTATVPGKLADANLTENAASIVPKSKDELLGPWLSMALQSSVVQAQIEKHTGRVTIGKLALFRIETLQLVIPSAEEQRRFVDISAGVEKAASEVRSAIAADDELFASLQARAFRGEL